MLVESNTESVLDLDSYVWHKHDFIWMLELSLKRLNWIFAPERPKDQLSLFVRQECEARTELTRYRRYKLRCSYQTKSEEVIWRREGCEFAEKIGSLFLSIHFYSELHSSQLCQVCTLLASTVAVTCLLENCSLYKQLSASTFHDLQSACKAPRRRGSSSAAKPKRKGKNPTASSRMKINNALIKFVENMMEMLIKLGMLSRVVKKSSGKLY